MRVNFRMGAFAFAVCLAARGPAGSIAVTATLLSSTRVAMNTALTPILGNLPELISLRDFSRS
jgi:hypothetical protein